MSRHVLVDLNNLFSRSKFAVVGDAQTKAGTAISNCFNALLKLEREGVLDHAVFCVDSRSWRYEALACYKAKRRLEKLEMTAREADDERVIMETLDRMAVWLGEKTACTVLRQHGIEADDFIGRWISLHPDDQHLIISSDSDFVQLISKNVQIHDLFSERRLSYHGVRDLETGLDIDFEVNMTSGKIKSKPGSPPPLLVEDEWWKKALFAKCMRGDVGDGIPSAAPKIRTKGTKKSAGLEEVWNDRKERGFCWTDVMQREIDKPVGLDANGEVLTERVRIFDQYQRNVGLIDLTAQPEEIISRMDETIMAAVQKNKPTQIGIALLQFCGVEDLPRLAERVSDHVSWLTKAYA